MCVGLKLRETIPKSKTLLMSLSRARNLWQTGVCLSIAAQSRGKLNPESTEWLHTLYLVAVIRVGNVSAPNFRKLNDYWLCTSVRLYVSVFGGSMWTASVRLWRWLKAVSWFGQRKNRETMAECTSLPDGMVVGLGYCDPLWIQSLNWSVTRGWYGANTFRLCPSYPIDWHGLSPGCPFVTASDEK